MELTQEEYEYVYAAMTLFSEHEYILCSSHRFSSHISPLTYTGLLPYADFTVPFYTFFVATIYPQKWRLGKLLFVILRYFPFMIIAIDLASAELSESCGYICSGMQGVVPSRDDLVVVLRIDDYAGDVTLLLCLWALLGASKRRFLALFALLFTAMPIALSIVFTSLKMTEPVPQTALDEAIGFPCSWAAGARGTLHYAILQYVNSAKTAILALVATIVLFVRHRRHTGSLLRVIRRDGGIHYITLTVVRLMLAITNTPTVTWAVTRPEIAAVTYGFGRLVVPVLGQRLLLNIRRVDYMGSVPMASTLLFAPSSSSTGEASEDYDESTKVIY
ncbi:hypothetical protein NMY22_g15202 [Coprinellus aureogranulatus]|nr:hypothetical protein NMY22_g15202 [Coprinellus aureogranulatus]